jgi:hypothetical protein
MVHRLIPVNSDQSFLLCDVRGPEGLSVELAERLDDAPAERPD